MSTTAFASLSSRLELTARDRTPFVVMLPPDLQKLYDLEKIKAPDRDPGQSRMKKPLEEEEIKPPGKLKRQKIQPEHVVENPTVDPQVKAALAKAPKAFYGVVHQAPRGPNESLYCVKFHCRGWCDNMCARLESHKPLIGEHGKKFLVWAKGIADSVA